MSSAEPTRGRAGFTLIEVLVSLVLVVLLGGVIFQVVQGESRFATVQSAREEVQQNSRGALEILASELRSVQRSGLVKAYSDSITFLLPRVWGVSCGVSGGVLAALFPAAGGVAFDINGASGLLADTSAAASGKWGPSANPNLADRATVTGLTAINPALGNAASPCNGIRADADPNGRLVGYTIAGANLPAVVPAGNTLYLYQLVTYDVGQSGSEWWIRRKLGSGTQQPLAGPLNGATGLAFTYWDANGTNIPAPITALATLQTVARINITVSTASRAKGQANLTNTQSTSVMLRNQ